MSCAPFRGNAFLGLSCGADSLNLSDQLRKVVFDALQEFVVLNPVMIVSYETSHAGSVGPKPFGMMGTEDLASDTKI